MSPLDSVRPASNAIPLNQVLGDLNQLLNPIYDLGANTYGQPTHDLSASTYGIWGTDASPCTLLPTNDIFCINGDTQGVLNDPVPGHCGLSAPNLGCTLNFKFANTGCAANNGCITGGTSPNSGLKAMYIIPNSGGNVASLAGCNAIFNVDAGLTLGNTPTANYTGCPPVIGITNSTRTSAQPKFASQNNAGLGTSADGIAETTDNGNVPSSTFVAGGHLYIIWAVSRIGVGLGGNGYLGDTILEDCGVTTGITSASPSFILSADPTCTKLYVWSQAPSVGTAAQNGAIAGTFTGNVTGAITSTSGTGFPGYICCDSTGNGLIFVDETNGRQYRVTTFTDANHITVTPVLHDNCSGGCTYSVMQKQQTNIGKFLTSSVEVWTVASLPSAVKNALPAALQAATTVLFVWGSDYTRNMGNLYFMAMDASLISGSTCTGGVPANCYAYATSGGVRANGTTGGLEIAYYLTGLSATGVPTWTNNATLGAEQAAVPLFTTFNHLATSKVCQTYNSPSCPGSNLDVGIGVQKPSVMYHSALKRWVAMYSSTNTGGTVQLRTSSTPWGIWSGENQIEVSSNSLNRWAGKMYTPATLTPNFNFNTPNNALGGTTGIRCDGTLGTRCGHDRHIGCYIFPRQHHLHRHIPQWQR
jgi:hypothetical protein